MRKKRPGASRFRPLPTVTARLFRLGFPVRTVVAVVVGCRPRRMIPPRHLSSNQAGNVDDHPVEIFTGGAARFFDTASSVRRA